MKNKIVLLCLLSQILTWGIIAKPQHDSLFLAPEESLHIFANNRILAKVNGKAISVLDVMKKMDMLFYRQFPQYISSIQARFQYYQMHWKNALQDLIDKELVLADAEESKMQVSNGDVRQEMESLFGPNIIESLDKIGLTFEEAWKMVWGDITIKRMLYYRVNAKAMKRVTPQVVRTAYEKYAQENIIPDKWHYYVISIRDNNPKRSLQTANQVYKLTQENIPLEELSEKIKNKQLDVKSSVNISDEIQHAEKELSEAYKKALDSLQQRMYSQPLLQKSRTDKSTLYRIFYLKEIRKGGMVPFNEMENKITDELLNIEIATETEAYLKRLRQHFDVQDHRLKEMIAEDFQPFQLK